MTDQQRHQYFSVSAFPPFSCCLLYSSIPNVLHEDIVMRIWDECNENMALSLPIDKEGRRERYEAWSYTATSARTCPGLRKLVH